MAETKIVKGRSCLMKEIDDLVQSGGNITHILDVRITNQRTQEEGQKIRRRIFQYIANTPRYQTVRGMNFPIKWRTSATMSTSTYHCDLYGLLGDTAVKEHSKALLYEVLKSLDNEFDSIFSRKITIVSFWITKPLVNEVCLY